MSLELELVALNLERVVVVQLGDVESDVEDVLGRVVLTVRSERGEDRQPGLYEGGGGAFSKPSQAGHGGTRYLRRALGPKSLGGNHIEKLVVDVCVWIERCENDLVAVTASG